MVTVNTFYIARVYVQSTIKYITPILMELFMTTYIFCEVYIMHMYMSTMREGGRQFVSNYIFVKKAALQLKK